MLTLALPLPCRLLQRMDELKASADKSKEVKLACHCTTTRVLVASWAVRVLCCAVRALVKSFVSTSRYSLSLLTVLGAWQMAASKTSYVRQRQGFCLYFLGKMVSRLCPMATRTLVLSKMRTASWCTAQCAVPTWLLLVTLTPWHAYAPVFVPGGQGAGGLAGPAGAAQG